MNLHEYMLLATGEVVPYPDGIPTAREIGPKMIECKAVAYFWPADCVYSHGRWYVLMPIFETLGGTEIPYESLPDIVKFAVLLT